jgi:hypothetical protein
VESVRFPSGDIETPKQPNTRFTPGVSVALGTRMMFNDQHNMWCIDIYSDFGWINEHWPVDQKLQLPMNFETWPGTKFTLLVYGDDFEIKHLRIKTELTSKEETERFMSEKLVMIKNSFETFTGIIGGKQMNFGSIVDGRLMITFHHEGDGPPCKIMETVSGEPIKFDYQSFAQVLGLQFPGFEPYCFYLNMASNPKLPVDYRWLNYYRILETRFNQSGEGLDYSDEYRAFLTSANRITKGKIAEIRGSIHAFARGATPGIGQYDSKYAKEMERTLLDMQVLALEAVNTHPSNRGYKFFPK